MNVDPKSIIFKPFTHYKSISGKAMISKLVNIHVDKRKRDILPGHHCEWGGGNCKKRGEGSFKVIVKDVKVQIELTGMLTVITQRR